MVSIFRHDACPECVYLGPYGERENVVEFDLWFCTQGANLPTVIARYGDEGWEYDSGIYSQSPPLVEATRRAVERGLIRRYSA